MYPMLRSPKRLRGAQAALLAPLFTEQKVGTFRTHFIRADTLADSSPRQLGYVATQMQNILSCASAPCLPTEQPI